MSVQQSTRATSHWSGLLRSTRPHQWVKNLLVVAAPLAAGTLFESRVFFDTTIAFLAFCLAAAAVYLINDVLDIVADQAHPDKSKRPIAMGTVTRGTAVGAAGLLATMSLVIPLALGLPQLALLMLAYLVLQAAYVTWTKHQPVLDLASVATGFVLRAIAGGVAANIPVSTWFLSVTAAVAMFVVAGKRYSEYVCLGAGETRTALRHYTPEYLRFVWGASVGIAVVFYGLWAAELGGADAFWARVSVVPFLLMLLVYARGIDTGRAEAPERLVLRDRTLQVLGLCWLAMFAMQVLR